MIRKREILFINVAAGLIAGTLLGVGEILYQELRTRLQGTVLVEEAEAVTKGNTTDGTGD